MEARERFMAVWRSHMAKTFFFFFWSGPNFKLKQIEKKICLKEGVRINWKKKPKHGPVCLLKHLSWSLTSFPETQPSFTFWLLPSEGRADITKSVALMIDSRHTEHPGLSGHSACTCSACSAVNVCGPTSLFKSHTVLLTLTGVGGKVRVGSRLTFNKAAWARWGKWKIRVCPQTF